MRQAEIERASAERIAIADNNIDIARLKRDVEAELWERARSEFASERLARKEIETELETERQARHKLAEAFESLRARVAELEDENRRLRADNVALTSELSRYTGRKL